ncbi:MAG: undecaprenyldiphospho-muramoylpentapeptide beta-N-acetylglucosaminyltransferase [Deltaproteobacteria bacterium]|jgi:UDP-N-acetylglucosamine--N-acetylmuramyl-(pentapeptide) pyrophosphoryl-undecaprenol N-acetylglucosamine transferase|nr:undecaprenyldiphospho-muramoylpentapeptide beta-N-acetylglucosaminyltransferase [Deltaproteobacteria bacterium]
MKKNLRVLIAAGGTGGHVIPAATVAEEIRSLRPEAEFLFVGAGRPAEEEILAPLGYPRKILGVPTLAGKGPAKFALGLFGLAKSAIGAISIVRDFKPDICLAFGGYVCGPLGLAAKMFWAPLVLHEQNSKPGLTNRWLGRVADLVMVGFPEAETAFKARRVELVGNPVRKEISQLFVKDRPVAGDCPLILVVGGSQGSRKINQAVTSLATSLARNKVPFRLVHQTGIQMAEEVSAVYRSLGIQAQVNAFIPDMASVYAKADLAIARAGALTLAELTAARLPAILVPLPTAAGDHQTTNAKSMESHGLALMVPEGEIDGGALEKAVLGFLQNPGKLKAMSDKARNSPFDPALVGPNMARLCLEVLENSQGHGPGRKTMDKG